MPQPRKGTQGYIHASEGYSLGLGRASGASICAQKHAAKHNQPATQQASERKLTGTDCLPSMPSRVTQRNMRTLTFG